MFHDCATVDHKQDLDMFFILKTLKGNKFVVFLGDFSSAILSVSIHGSFVSFHDRLCLEPRVSKCTNQHLWCRIVEGIKFIQSLILISDVSEIHQDKNITNTH